MGATRASVESMAARPLVRLAFAVAMLCMHLVAIAALGRERFDLPFDREPASAPAFGDPSRDGEPHSWSRLLTSRWDSQHYIGLALRGYQYCPSRDDLATGKRKVEDRTCQLVFYPGYAWVGAALRAITRLPIDVSLLAVSFASTILLLYLWTGQMVVRAIGIGRAYLSALLLNTFTTGFLLATAQTHAITLCLTMVTFVLFARRRLLLAALVAGAAGTLRFQGVCVGLALSAALAWLTWSERDLRPRLVASRVALCLVAGWGALGLMAYYGWRFHDPLAYAHAQMGAYHYSPSLRGLLWPKAEWVVVSLVYEPNGVLGVVAALLWFALGHRRGLGRFAPPERVFWYVLYALVIGLSMYGLAPIDYGGMAHYALTALPLFFCMADVLWRKWAAVVVWIAMSLFHYYNVNLCFYVGQGQPGRLDKCYFQQHR